MGNGLVKPKKLKQPDGTLVTLSINSNGNKLFQEGTDALLKTKVAHLERESKRKDEEMRDKDSKIKSLTEHLSKQTATISELTEELQNKCIQLNKLQDVIKTQGGNSLYPSPLKARINQQVNCLFKETLNRRKGAKEGVSAEPTSRTYGSSKLPKFSFEKVRVRKDSSVKKLITEALNKNQFLKRLEAQQIKDMVECMYERNYHQGDHVIKQGEPGNHLFVVAEGKLDVFQQSKFLTTMSVWTAFGELAILYNCTRTASVRAVSHVKTWALDREVFQNIMRRTAQARHEQYRNFLRSDDFRSANIIADENDVECLVIDRETFNQTVGTFDELQKYLQGYVENLTRDDEKRHARGSFDESTAKLCVGCVTEAFDYLHQNGIIYRDLKPENLMVDSEGYIKLVDFGFAKKIGSGQKTWTFCGTPEYVAPEIILNKGHDFSVDFWSLGILVFELLTGSPPFSGADQMTTYNLILKGIEKMDFPKKITRRPEDLIRKLCRQNPTERLGNLKNGITDIKKHR
ncbi:UNVERIFIED_CONTAM: hypothetical protein FKN15_018746 [Acipenser sinensis]